MKPSLVKTPRQIEIQSMGPRDRENHTSHLNQAARLPVYLYITQHYPPDSYNDPDNHTRSSKKKTLESVKRDLKTELGGSF